MITAVKLINLSSPYSYHFLCVMSTPEICSQHISIVQYNIIMYSHHACILDL